MITSVQIVTLLDRGLVDYTQVDTLQRSAHEAVLAGGEDTIIVSQFTPTWTAGRHTKPEDIPSTTIPVIRTDRAGSATWHGPGQVVVYPVVRLREPVDLVQWIRAVEASVIDTVRDVWELPVHRVEGRAGVWLTEEGRRDRKICAIGLKVARGATLHGIALNVDIDPAHAFEGIILRSDGRRRHLPVMGRRGNDRARCRIRASPAHGGAHLPLPGDRSHFRFLHDEVTAMSTLPDPEGRKLLRIEVRNSQTPIEKKPEWIRTTAKAGENYQDMRSLSHAKGLHTVCAEAGCPNIYECWQDREATFLLGGALCTRRCDFCDIATGRPTEYDRDEPRRIAESVRDLDLRYVTITGVTRDDLPDGAAWLYAQTCRLIHELNPGTGVELLVDDFRGQADSIDMVIEAGPQVFAHNLETVPRIFKKIRPAFNYERSLAMIKRAHDGGMVTKSNLILGMGETREEIGAAMRDLHESGCDLLTLTQYLRPSPLHHPIDRWVHPEEFVELAAQAEEMGFAGVMAGPLVRSSYRAGLLWAKGMRARGFEIPEQLRHIANSGSTLQEAGSVLARLKERSERHAAMEAAKAASAS